jgi:hypothetical protein
MSVRSEQEATLVEQVVAEAKLATEGYTLSVNKLVVLGSFAGTYFMRSRRGSCDLKTSETSLEDLAYVWWSFRRDGLSPDKPRP